MTAEDYAAQIDAIATVLDMVDAFRAACIERGYSPTASEAMAIDFARMLLQKASTS